MTDTALNPDLDPALPTEPAQFTGVFPRRDPYITLTMMKVGSVVDAPQLFTLFENTAPRAAEAERLWNEMDAEHQANVKTVVRDVLQNLWIGVDDWVPNSAIRGANGELLEFYFAIAPSDLRPPVIEEDDRTQFQKKMAMRELSADRAAAILKMNMAQLVAFIDKELGEGVTPDFLVAKRLLELNEQAEA